MYPFFGYQLDHVMHCIARIVLFAVVVVTRMPEYVSSFLSWKYSMESLQWKRYGSYLFMQIFRRFVKFTFPSIQKSQEFPFKSQMPIRQTLQSIY